MPYSFTLPPLTRPTADPIDDPLDQVQLDEDISLLGGDLDVTPAGDWATVRGVDAAKQSVIREFVHNPGSLPYRPEWGIGLQGLLFKGQTPSVKDEIVSRGKARLRVNPRILRVTTLSADTDDDGNLAVSLAADAIGGRLSLSDEVIKP